VATILYEALTKVPSEGIDPSLFMLSKPEPKEGAVHNGDTLPSLFLFLLDHFAKAIISQLASEASINKDAADPIGILVAQIFSSPNLQWRGTTMIDIFMAKMWKECPVLFGARGNEKTEEGRARLGWRKENEEWVEELAHTNRMTGLSSGYAAISLRNFSRTKLENPYPPYHYWQSLASIASTPPNETSTTQFTVLKGLIEGFEGKFMEFYGDAAKAALRIALVDFPGMAPDQNNTGVNSLKVLADILERDTGLILR
jgi:nucleoporin GLE1